ncbi:receptor kinase-like protein Xa21 [Iris pallida]|uniref:Receptor kinase-like protein Xa21 n=1 Tax=Iris pallida TaxID=29817 RepID=A0AAX6HPX2_IRIPA|nr:receptor kinase-like protein Xa21 [Iris pallida]
MFLRMLVLLLLPLLISSSTNLSSNSTDLLPLLSFKASITMDPSKALASWNQTIHPCQWQGVVCAARKHPNRVTSLSLDSLNLAGSLSPSIANLSFLQVLQLGGNQLQGQVPQSFTYLTHLKHLNLSFNSLVGEIPAGLANCSSLLYLDLSNNQLEGAIPVALSGLPKLLQLALYSNTLTGTIPTSFGNLSSLAGLLLAGNNLEGSIPDTLGWLSHLQSLQLAINGLSGEVPASIYNLSSLHTLNFGGNRLRGSLPHDIGDTLPSLQSVSMYGNQFEGPIPISLANASGLQFIILDNNSFTGAVPPNFGALLNLSWLVLSNNQLEAGDGGHGWTFLDSLTNCSYLHYLELYSNEIRGELPKSIANLSTELSWLTLGHNRVSGSIPPEVENLVGLEALFFEENLLTGAIPDTIGKLKLLQSLWLFDNKLSGPVPASLGNLSQLSELYLQVNELQGTIPTSLGNLRSLTTLNVSYNNLSGEIPEELVSLSSLSRYLDLAYNSLTGTLPSEVGRLINLKELNVSNNRLSGVIPGSLGRCQVLEFLYMDSNFFRSTIPASLENLKGLRELNLSRNNLSGQIPDFLQSLNSLRYLNLSFNDFEGEVPTTGVFAELAASSVEGNDELCGGSPNLRLQVCSVRNERRTRASVLVLVLSVVGGAVLLCLLICLLVFCCRRHRHGKQTSSRDYYMEDMHKFTRVSYTELYNATNGFSSSSLIGVGSFGSVYRGALEGNGEVAVKVLNLERKGAAKSFVAECDALKNVRHRNLVKLLTSCSAATPEGDEFKALVYEFLPNGSLEEWLHPKPNLEHQGRNLSPVQRLNVAVDVAAAFEYLHHHAQTEIVHCDLKPSNVLLDSDMVAHVGDFGLARFVSADAGRSSHVSPASLGLKGSIGYIAPEYGMGRQATIRGDVYSYGVLLLEMLTGLRPTSDKFNDGLNLRSYVQASYPEKVMEIIDQSMLQEDYSTSGANSDSKGNKGGRSEGLEQLFASLIRIGLRCSEEEPKLRMDIRDVCREMTTCKQIFLGVELH